MEVTVVFVPPRLRSFMPKEPPEHDEWRRRNRLPHPNRVSPPHDFLLHRYAELAEALRNGTLPPVLLATPTWMSGHLDPDVLIDRLETCAAAASSHPGRPGAGAAAVAQGLPPGRGRPGREGRLGGGALGRPLARR
ncbi:hypothetical protein GCM10027612_72220 [Microbispora bryophytorum subsp. camponoti]